MSGVERITEWQVLPKGCPEDNVNAPAFAVTVKWRGRFEGKSGGGWSVSNGGSDLSRAGTWTFYVPRFRRWQHRWETFEEACDRARNVVDSVVVNGGTWSQWQERRR